VVAITYNKNRKNTQRLSLIQNAALPSSAHTWNSGNFNPIKAGLFGGSEKLGAGALWFPLGEMIGEFAAKIQNKGDPK